MKSPFPGMDPYLDAYWPSVHGKLVIYAGEALNALLPADLTANTEERIGIEADDGDSGFIAPDVSVTHAYSRSNPSGAGVAEEMPGYILLALTEVSRERYIEITTADGSHLITVIEFISPSNKNQGRADFVNKREALLDGGVNFVEIDLTRGGDWRKLLLPQRCPPPAVSTYRYTIRLPQKTGAACPKPISIRTVLPSISIPLREGEARIDLPLQPLVERAYVSGRYDRKIRYDIPPKPPLDDADAAWAKELIAARAQ